MIGLIVHLVSISFAVLLIPVTLIGAFNAAYMQKPLEAALDLAAFCISCWLSKKLCRQCLDKLDKVC